MKRLLVLSAVCLLWACSPERKDAKVHAPTGSWPGLSPSAPRERPVKHQEPRRYGRRAYATALSESGWPPSAPPLATGSIEPVGDREADEAP